MIEQNSLILSDRDAFAVYREPYSNDIVIVKQENSHFYKFDKFFFRQKGFVLFPFDENQNKPVFIKADSIYINKKFKFDTRNKCTVVNISKDDYLLKANGFIEKIKSGFRKIVLSRTKSILRDNIDIYQLFMKLELKYKNAFVFLVNHPKSGTWMGATPETLIKANGSNASTVALAGTQYVKDTEGVIWENKEIDEQKAVMDYIEDVLDKNKIKYHSKGPNTKIAARNINKTLVHLATEYTFDVKDKLYHLIKELHPTPAVSGMPKEGSIKFINDNEGYNREYYTGFLGPINIVSGNSISLFVNLRSMKVYKDEFLLYLGGGLNSQSIAIKEWEETENKAKTLEEVIEGLK